MNSTSKELLMQAFAKMRDGLVFLNSGGWVGHFTRSRPPRLIPQIRVTTEQSAYIRERIERYAEEAPKESAWLGDHVCVHQALPLFVSWTEAVGICPDGTLIRWQPEEWPGASEFNERTWVNLALVQGAIRYPALRSLIPPKPTGAETCSMCAGTGSIMELAEQHKAMICECGGIGWLESA